MGMMINRRRIAGKKEDTYIQDGLVLWLDGFSGIGKNSWTDLVSGVVFTSNSMTKTTNGVKFNSGARTTDDLYFPDTYTLEAVCEDPTFFVSPGAQIFYCGKNNSVSLQMWQEGVITRIPGSPIYSRPKDGKIHVHSVIPNGFYIDGSARVAGSNDIIAINGTGTSIGAKYSTNNVNTYNKEICSIRIYNRTLTEAEINNNVAVDNIRFNLGLNI